MIKAFNRHYRKALELIEDLSTTEKIETAERVLDWLRELPEEYTIALALFFNEVIDDLGDESLEKIDLRAKPKKELQEEEEEEEEDEFEEEEDDDEDYDEE